MGILVSRFTAKTTCHAVAAFLSLVAFNNACAQTTPAARQFFETIVKSDLDGDAFPRIGHVGRKPGPPDPNPDVGPSFEVYMLESDPLVVVSDWRLVGFARRNGAECATFRFTVLARTVGEGLPSWMSTKTRRIVAVEPPRQENVAYCANLSEGKWMLIDPPLPRVNKAVLLRALQERVAQASKNAADPGSPDPRAATNSRRVYEALREQLSVVSALE